MTEPPDLTPVALLRLRTRVLEAEAAATVGDADDVLALVTALRRIVLDVSSAHGNFRQHFDRGVSDVESWARHGDMAAVCTSLDTLRALLSSIEEDVARA